MPTRSSRASRRAERARGAGARPASSPGGQADWQSDFADALLDPARPPPAGLVTWNGSDAATRFAVYRNNVVSSLVAALGETFAVTRALVGEEFFAAMARAFVAESPPDSPVLATYGGALPAFIEGFAPARGVPYLADVARLEALRVAAYHAADAVSLSRAELERLLADPGRLPDARLALHPSAAGLASRYAVVSLWAAHHGSLRIEEVDPYVAEEALVARPELEVEVSALPPGGCRLLARLAAGATLAEAAADAARSRADFDLAGVLAALIRARALGRAPRRRQARGDHSSA